MRRAQSLKNESRFRSNNSKNVNVGGSRYHTTRDPSGFVEGPRKHHEIANRKSKRLLNSSRLQAPKYDGGERRDFSELNTDNNSEIEHESSVGIRRSRRSLRSSRSFITEDDEKEEDKDKDDDDDEEDDEDDEDKDEDKEKEEDDDDKYSEDNEEEEEEEEDDDEGQNKRIFTLANNCNPVRLKEKDYDGPLSCYRRPKKLDSRPFGIPQAPTLFPTEDEFHDPIQYLQSNIVRQLGEKYGILKIVPPASWKPPLVLDKDFSFSTRQQDINTMGAVSRAEIQLLDKLVKFHSSRKLNVIEPQTITHHYIEGNRISLYHLKRIITANGGLKRIETQNCWADVAKILGIPIKFETAEEVRKIYLDIIHPFETHIKDSNIKPGRNTYSKYERKYNTDYTKKEIKDGCQICGKDEDYDHLMLCDECDKEFHIYCLEPKLDAIPKGKWYCEKCITSPESFGFEAGGDYTLPKFQQKCDKFRNKYFKKIGLEIPDLNSQLPEKLYEQENAIELEFWRLVDSLEDTVKVEYGADIHSNVQVSGFPTIKTRPDDKYSKDPWNPNVLPHLQKSLLRNFSSDISGMTVPWSYIGMIFSAFCWHNEDHYTYSANYQHLGETKTWYGIPAFDAEKFEKVMKLTVPELFQQQPDLLFQLTTLHHPKMLMKSGVSVYAVDQRPGEFVITCPKVYHAGFNHGFNFNEAVNFAPPVWLPFCVDSFIHYKHNHHQPVFAYDELLVNTAKQDYTHDIVEMIIPYLQQSVQKELNNRSLIRSKLPWVGTRKLKCAQKDEEMKCAICNGLSYLSQVIVNEGKKDESIFCLEDFIRTLETSSLPISKNHYNVSLRIKLSASMLNELITGMILRKRKRSRLY